MTKRTCSLVLAFVMIFALLPMRLFTRAAENEPVVLAKGGAAGSSSLLLYYDTFVAPTTTLDAFAQSLLFGKTTPLTLSSLWDNWLADVVTADLGGGTHVSEYRVVLTHPTPDTTLIKLNLKLTLMRINDYTLRMPEGALTDGSGYPVPALSKSVSLDASVPKLSQTVLGRDNRTLTLMFSENIYARNGGNISDSLSRFGLAQADSTTETAREYKSMEFTSSTSNLWVGVSSVRIEKNKLIVVFAQPLSKKYNYLRLEENTLFDIVGNALVADKTIKGNDGVSRKYTVAGPFDATVDSAPPDITDATATPDNKQIVITFNKPIFNNMADMASLRDALRLAFYEYVPGTLDPVVATPGQVEAGYFGGATTAPPNKLLHTDSVKIVGSQLIITFTQPLSNALFTAVRVPSNAVKDKTGNVHDPALAALPDMAGYTYQPFLYTRLIDTISDRVTPAYKDVVLGEDLKTITLLFSEPVRIRLPHPNDPEWLRTAALKSMLELRRDGDTAYRALNEVNRWNKEICDSLTVSGSKIVIVLHEILEGKQNYIRLTRAEALCDFAQDAAPWRDNNLLDKAFVTKALDATADVSPPLLVTDKPNAAVSPDGRKLTLLFNEALVNNLKNMAELRGALSVTFFVSDGVQATRDLSTFDAGSSVSISGSTLVITFSKKLTQLLPVSRSYQTLSLTLRAQNGAVEGAVKDKAGNIQKADQLSDDADASGDITPPKVKNIIASPNRTTVTLYFDENVQSVRSGASLLSNLMVLRGFTASDAPALADFQAKEAFFTTAKFASDKLVLTLRMPLDGDRNFILIRGNTVSDVAGNTIVGDLSLGPIDAFPDTTPPVLKNAATDTQFWLSADRTTLKLFFNEFIYPVDMELPALLSNIGRSTTSDGGPFADLSAVDKADFTEFTLTITFAAPLTGAKNWFRIKGGALKDEYNNVQLDESKLTTACINAVPDELPPVYKSASVSTDNRVITLTFSEPVAAAVSDPVTLRSRILFTDGKTFYPMERFYPGYTAAFTGSTLVLTLPSGQTLVGKTNKVKILKNTIQDKATPDANVLAADVATAAFVAWADETPPGFNPLSGTVLSANKKTLTLTFSEPLFNNKSSLTALKAGLLIARDGSRFVELSYNDAVSLANNTLVITFDKALSGDKTKVRLRAASVKDASGNVLNKEITTNAVSTGDRTPPVFDAKTGVAINDSNKKTVALTFSEPVISGYANVKDLKDVIRVKCGGGAFRPLAAKDTVSVSGGKLTVIFAEPLTGNDNYLMVPAAALSDKAFNAMTRDTLTGRIYATPPAFDPVTGYAINAARKIIALTFDREVFAMAGKKGGLTASVKISRNGGAFAPLGPNDTADVIDGKLCLTFQSALGERDMVSIPAKSVHDYVGNTQQAEILTGPAAYRPATIEPKTGITLSKDCRLVTLTFNKPVASADGALSDGLAVRRNNGASTALTGADKAEIVDGKLAVWLSTPLMGENNFIVIGAGTLIDNTGVRLDTDLGAGPIDAGVFKGEVPVTLDDESVTGSALLVYRTPDGRKMASVMLDATNVKDAASTSADGALLETEAPKEVDGVAIQGVSLVTTGDVLEALQKKNITLVLKRGGVSYLLPSADIDLKATATQMGAAFSSRSAVNFSLTIQDSDAKVAEKLSQHATKNKYTVLVPPVDFEVTVQSAVRTLPVDRYANRVQRRFLLPVLAQNSPHITAVTLDKDGSPVHIPTKVNRVGGQSFACAWSFTNSSYAVVSATRDFPDVKTHWSKPYVVPMASRFMLFGDTKGLFNPDKNITRAEFAAVLLRSLGLTKSGVGVDRFADVPRSAWYYDTVSISSEYRLLSAYADGNFKPDQAITRHEAFVAVYNALILLEGKAPTLSSEQARRVLRPFSDAASAADSALVPLAVCVQRGILEGNGNRLNPKDNIRRGEVCALFDRFMRKTSLIG